MQSGIYWGYINLIDGIINQIRHELKVDLKVISTGGLAHIFASDSQFIDLIDENLTINGLYLIAQRLNL